MERIDLELDRRIWRERRADSRTPEAARLYEALGRGEIEILFQPQFAASDGRLLGAEALARWRHPEHVLIDGAALFESAERAGLARHLWRHVARTALGHAAGWGRPLRLSLNITAADLAEEEFPEQVAVTVGRACFPAERLTLEITEQVLVADLDRSAEQLRQLASLGIRIALDDFGAGFCNFGYLKRLPLHYLKLDRSMAEGIDSDPRDLAVLRGILAMAHALGLEVVAEGIEREAQRAAIAREGCSSWQGFLGAKPMDPIEFAKLTFL
ncbi:MAG TPA: EAL domain-containing protein [Croceibacterium sp.]